MLVAAGRQVDPQAPDNVHGHQEAGQTHPPALGMFVWVLVAAGGADQSPDLWTMCMGTDGYARQGDQMVCTGTVYGG